VNGLVKIQRITSIISVIQRDSTLNAGEEMNRLTPFIFQKIDEGKRRINNAKSQTVLTAFIQFSSLHFIFQVALII